MRSFFWPRGERFSKNGSVRVRVVYDGQIAAAAGKKEEISWASDGTPFVLMLQAIITEHPDIEHRFPSGHLRFTLNGRDPEQMATLHDGDEICIFLSAKGVAR